jgi:NADPH-dependent 2,4-dienoyl-CoA reductase/sulfur reductase-like enzyme
MISDEKHMPYDRIMVSKDFSKAPPPLRAAGFHDEYGIEVQLGSKIAEVDALSKTISFANGTSLKYDKAIIASGCSARRLPPSVSSPNFTNVHSLRTADDTAALKAAAAGAKNVVIVGAGFIGLEAAFALKKQLNVANVTVVEPSQVPLQHVLGAEVGAVFRSIHEKNGVNFKLGSGVKAITGSSTAASSVTLSDGSTLPCDLVVVAIGVQPNTDFVKGVTKANDGSITVDPFFRSTSSSLYAAGDVARFPYFLTGESVRIEHWAHAQQCGRVAGRNAAGRSQKFETVPYFWTMQWGDKINYVGNATSFDHVHVEGSLADKKFMAYYCKGDHVLAVAAMGIPNAATYTAEALRLGSMPSLVDLKSGANLASIQATLRSAASGCCGGGGGSGCCGSKVGEDKAA